MAIEGSTESQTGKCWSEQENQQEERDYKKMGNRRKKRDERQKVAEQTKARGREKGAGEGEMGRRIDERKGTGRTERRATEVGVRVNDLRDPRIDCKYLKREVGRECDVSEGDAFDFECCHGASP